MTRLWLCVLALGGAIGFLSCDSGTGGPGASGVDGSGPRGGSGGSAHGGGAGTASDGAGPSGGRGGGCPPGYACDGTGPVGGRGGGGGGCPPGYACDGTGPIGGSGGHTDGAGPVGGTAGHTDGAGPVGGRGGGCSLGCDGLGPVAGRGGSGGTGGAAQPCDGLIYFTQRGLCASTYAAQAAKQVPGNCDYVRVFTGSCGGQQVWTTRYQSLGDPVTCGYDSAGNLAGARTCTDTPVSQWNCNGAATSPSCLNAGTLVDPNACTLTTTCDATGGHGGGSAGGDGAGPVGGHGGGS